MVSLRSLATTILALCAFNPTMALPTDSAAISPIEDAATLGKRQASAKIWYCEHTRWGGKCRGQEGGWGQCGKSAIHRMPISFPIAARQSNGMAN